MFKNTFYHNRPAIVALAIIFFVWEGLCQILELAEYILPAPSKIFLTLLTNLPILLNHTRVTLSAVLAGLSLAVVIAFATALAMNHWQKVRTAFYPLLVISQAVPIFALAPLMLIWFGVGLLPKVVIVALVCFFPLAVNLVEGFSQVDPDALDLLKVMQAKPAMVFMTVQLPSVLPYFFSGLKIAVSYSVIGAIIGEWLAARAGLGIYMLRSMNSFQTVNLFAAIIIVVLLSLIMFKLVELAAWLVMPWQRKNTKSLEEFNHEA